MTATGQFLLALDIPYVAGGARVAIVNARTLRVRHRRLAPFAATPRAALLRDEDLAVTAEQSASMVVEPLLERSSRSVKKRRLSTGPSRAAQVVVPIPKPDRSTGPCGVVRVVS